jgi:hypothetical protein
LSKFDIEKTDFSDCSYTSSFLFLPGTNTSLEIIDLKSLFRHHTASLTAAISATTEKEVFFVHIKGIQLLFKVKGQNVYVFCIAD